MNHLPKNNWGLVLRLCTMMVCIQPFIQRVRWPSQGENGEVVTPVLDQSVVTQAERLKEAGYSTVLFGEQAQLNRRFALDQGFDVYRNHLGGTKKINDALGHAAGDAALRDLDVVSSGRTAGAQLDDRCPRIRLDDHARVIRPV